VDTHDLDEPTLVDNAFMDFFDVVRERRSVRAFQDRAVNPDLIRRVLETAIAAPSAGNRQAYKIYLVDTAEGKAALAAAAWGQQFLSAAAAVLVFCADPGQSSKKYGDRGERLYALQDATIACSFAMLAATALGLATVWVGAFHDEAVHAAIGSPKGIAPVAMLPLGYAAESPDPTYRRAFERMVQRV
jgi:nitroreductase